MRSRRMATGSRKLAQMIASRLFTNGQGEQAERLVLELADKRDGGGWCRKAVEDVIADALERTASVPMDRQERKDG